MGSVPADFFILFCLFSKFVAQLQFLDLSKGLDHTRLVNDGLCKMIKEQLTATLSFTLVFILGTVISSLSFKHS